MSRKERLQKLVREYWKAKNLCACYTDMYGTYEDSQMVHWARRAQTLGQQIKELKQEERDALV